TSHPTAAVTPTPRYPPEAHIKTQCLKVEPSPPGLANSIGSVVMDNRVLPNGTFKPETYLRNMTTGKTVTIPFGTIDVVSADHSLLALFNPIFDDDYGVISKNLIVADADGRVLKVIPWEREWQWVLGWIGDHSLLLSWYSASSSYKQLVLNLSTGERNFLQ